MKNGWILAVILLLTTLIFASMWDVGHLTWDDDSNIFANPYFTMHRWWGVWSEPYFGLYVPVTSTVWAALYTLGDGQTWPFRALNLGLHIGNILLLYALLVGLAKRWRLTSPVAIGFAVAIFALHPMQTETVAWISGGRDLLSTFLSLLTVVVYFRWPRLWGRILAFVIFLVAILSKPSVVVLPLALWLADVLIEKKPWRKSLLQLTPWFALALFATFVTHAAQVGHFIDSVNLSQRPRIMADTYFFYIWKTLWPFPLSANYAHTPEKVLTTARSLWTAGALTALVIVAGIAAWRKDRRFLIASLWFVLLLPVSGLVGFAFQNISGVADHYIYLPMTITAAVLMLVWDRLWRWRPLMLIPVLLTGGWAWATWDRLTIWENDYNFFSDMAKNAPDSYNTAIGMSVVMCQGEKDYASGLKWTEKALEMQPNDILALANKAFCLLQAGRTQEVLQMDFYLDKLDTEYLAANQPTAYSSLLASIGGALIQEHRYEDGYQYLCEAFRVKPAEPNHARNLDIATEILKRQGLNPNCDDENTTETGE